MSSRAEPAEPVSQPHERIADLEREVESLQAELETVRREREAAMEWAEFLAAELRDRHGPDAERGGVLARLRRLLP